MDYHRLQQKLFELDPTDLREDYAKLKAQAQQGSGNTATSEKVDYLKETAQVKEGSLELDRDYSIDDFAALAGVVTESKKQKPADQVRGSEPTPKAEPGRTKHPMQDRLVGENDVEEGAVDAFKTGYRKYNQLDALKPTFSQKKSNTKLKQLSQGDSFKDKNGMVWYYNPRKQNWMSKDRRKTISAEEGFKLWMQSTSSRKRNAQESKINALESRISYLEDVIETLIENTNDRKIKPRDPNAQYMNDLRKSGAMGKHQDKKKAAKMGKTKHKGKQYESVKDHLMKMLKDNEL